MLLTHVIQKFNRSSSFFDVKNKDQKWYLRALPMQLKGFGKSFLVFIIHLLISFHEDLHDGVHSRYMEFTLNDLY